MLSMQVLVDLGRIKYLRNIYSKVMHRQTFLKLRHDFG